jgi:hypothetical protein
MLDGGSTPDQSIFSTQLVVKKVPKSFVPSQIVFTGNREPADCDRAMVPGDDPLILAPATKERGKGGGPPRREEVG